MGKLLPILYSRSAVTQDWRCPRSRWWGYEWGGRGLSSGTTSIELFLGITLHDGLAAIFSGLDIDSISEAAITQVKEHLASDSVEGQHYAAEQAALVEGLLRGFHRHVYPRLMDEYDVVDIEKELFYEHDGLTFMSKPDLLLRHKEGGHLLYYEYKSTSSVKDKWVGSWNTAVQLHSTIKAIEHNLKEEVSYCIVQGLNKGYVSQYDRQESIFCYGYYKAGQPPFNKDVWQYAYKAGLKKDPTWTKAGGVKQWVAEMPEEILSQQFPQTPPILINHDLVDAFFRQQASREHEIRRTRLLLMENPEATELLDAHFPQHFEQCSPGYGTGCQFKKLCFSGIADPLAAGYSLRVSHHDAEREQHDGLDNQTGA